MYGIIIEGVRLMIMDNFGPAVWQQCLEKAQLHDDNFATHERYSEKMIPNLLSALAELTGKTIDEIGITAGKYFIHYICKFGYNSLLQVLGKN